ncbi:MAG: glycosyltransferase family 39 protein [Acidobacteriota bacterium]
MQPSTLAKRGSLFLFLVIVAFYLYGLGQFPLLGPDEPRYAQVALEMFLRNDLITPTLGGHLWFEKPALLYWMMIASYKLFGVSEWSARFPSALSGILTIAGVFLVGRRVEETTADGQLRGLGFWSALAASTTLGIVVFSRAASFDIVLTMTITWSLAFLFLHELEEARKRRQILLIGFYVFIGLSLLAKGFIGAFIPAGVAGAYYLLRRRQPERETLLSLVWGIPVALLVAATWYAPVIWRHGKPFIDQFVWQHQFARYVSNNYRHPGPIYYYLAILIPLSLPWTSFLIGGVARACSWVWRPQNYSGDSGNKLVVFAFVWLLLPLVFFSFSSSKLPGYILPSLPAAALLVGERLARFNTDLESYAWKLKTSAGLLILGAVAIIAYAWRFEPGMLNCAALVAAILVVGACVALFPIRRRAIPVMFIAVTTLGVVLTVLSCGADAYADRDSSKRLLQLADARGYSQKPIYGLKLDDRSPEFYTAGRVIYGPDGEPVIYEGAPQLVNECRRRRTVLLAFVPLHAVSELQSAHAAHTEIIGDNGRVALVAVRPR